MLVDLIVLVLAIVVVGLVPVVMMATLFGLVDHLSDEEKLEEVRQANKEGRPVDFSSTDTSTDQQVGLDQLPSDATTDARGVSTASDTADQSQPLCPNCGEQNDGEYDRCWNCQTAL